MPLWPRTKNELDALSIAAPVALIRTDSDRLDWLESGRWDLDTSGGDEWRVYRRFVNGSRTTTLCFQGSTIREVIDKAMDDPTRQMLEVQAAMEESGNVKS